jgi:nifR3 family TIM-barrel protein
MGSLGDLSCADDGGLAAALTRPLAIGNRTIPGRLVFAPMSFLGHVAFRQLLAEFGGFGLLFSEMCNARAIPTESRHASGYFRWRDEELPFLVCQIFGAEPAQMAEAARRIEAEGFFGVDVNFGCATAAICRRSFGAALLRTPERAFEIVAAIRRAVSFPVTVKFRTGWRDDPAAAVAMARGFEEAGADAVTFHPRVAPDRRARAPKWEYIGRVKEALSIPVFGNGDVFDAAACGRMMRLTECDGVSLGRIAVARPWVFAEWADGFTPPADIFHRAALRLLKLTCAHFTEKAALMRFRKFAFYFAANFSFGHALHRAVQNAGGVAEVEEALGSFFGGSPALNSAPNMNFFQ